MEKKVLVALSGGVDSAACARLLMGEGYQVAGCVLKMSPAHETTVEDARRAAEELGIPLYVRDMQAGFTGVVRYFVDEYASGRTPNPCVVCNPTVKFRGMLAAADELGYPYIATGHYAGLRREGGISYLTRGVSAARDQSYMLCRLGQRELSRLIFPLSAMQKPDVRQVAETAGLSCAGKPDSQEICFIPDHDYARFIESYTGRRMPEGNFVDAKGQVLGRHRGISHYTVGQRKGLNLSMGRPVFVTEIRPETNEVVIGGGDQVFSSELTCSQVSWMAAEGLSYWPPGQPARAKAKIRYSHKGAACTLEDAGEGRLRVVFDEPQRAITPGQAVVFYDGEYVLGGGVID